MDPGTITKEPLEYPPLRSIFARNIEYWLHCNNTHAKQLAKKMLISSNSMYRLQRGEANSVSFEILEKLVEVTGKPIAYFFTKHPDLMYF